jgi:hypothetical protein
MPRPLRTLARPKTTRPFSGLRIDPAISSAIYFAVPIIKLGAHRLASEAGEMDDRLGNFRPIDPLRRETAEIHILHRRADAPTQATTATG